MAVFTLSMMLLRPLRPRQGFGSKYEKETESET